MDYMYKASDLRRRLDWLQTERTQLNEDWNRVLELVKPTRREMNKYQVQTMKTEMFDYASNLRNRLYDNQGSVNSLILTSYLHSSLTNPHDHWMTLENPISHSMIQLNNVIGQQDEEVQDFNDEYWRQDALLQACSDQMHLAWRSSNFHQEIFMFYKSLVDIGTACLAVFQGYNDTYKKGELSFLYKPMNQVYFSQDSRGRPNHVFCIYNWTAREVMDYFAKGMKESEVLKVFGQEILDCYKNWDSRLFTFVHAVYPDYSSKSESYHSCYFMYQFAGGSKKEKVPIGFSTYENQSEKDYFLKYSKIDYNPYLVSRIRKEGLYGTGFSMDAYPLLVLSQEAQRSATIAAKKNAEPPLNTPSQRLAHIYSSNPNAKNPMEFLGGRMTGVTPAIQPINLRDLIQNKEMLKMEIDKIYLIDRIIMESTKRDRTATEVQKRTGEEIKILSPFLGSLETEFLHPLGKITFEMLRKKSTKFIKEMFNELSKIGADFKYISDIAMAQTKKQVDTLTEAYARIKTMAESDPSLMNLVDWANTAKGILKGLNFNRLYINKPTDFAKKKEEFNRNMQGQQTAENISKVAPAAGQFYQNMQQGEKTRKEAVGLGS